METIYAIDSNNGLSKEGTIPWKSKKDMLFFMNKTKNNIVIMGKTTFFSLPNEHRPLKNRLNIVLTSNPHLYEDNNVNEHSNLLFTNNNNIHQIILQNRNKYCEMYKFLNNNYKIFFIGGKTIYEQFIPLCHKIWVTQIKGIYNCDLFIDYDYSKQFTVEIYEENDEIKILEYTRL
jgi:dihydrofolate reductase/thymidylate synthase